MTNVNYEQMIIRRVTRRIPVSGTRRFLGLFLSGVIAAGILAVSFFALRLYFQSQKTVDNHLKSQKWSLPSTIYADAPVLYEGMAMRPDTLVQYLQRLNFEK